MAEPPAEFQVKSERQNDAQIVRVTGEVDLSTHDRLGEELVSAAQAGEPLVVDLSGCSFIDSSGIRALLLGRRAVEKRSDGSGRFAIAGASDPVARVLELTRVNEAISLYESVDAALADV